MIYKDESMIFKVFLFVKCLIGVLKQKNPCFLLKIMGLETCRQHFFQMDLTPEDPTKLLSVDISHSIHVGIFTYMFWLFLMVKSGKCR